jgi:hypothetical protein
MAVDDSPKIGSPIADVFVDEGTSETIIDLTSVFTDIDNDDTAIVKTVHNNTNSGLISANIANDTLTLSFTANESGTGNITIRGTSNGKTVDTAFSVTVSSVDDPPYVLNAIEDITLNEDAADHEISLDTVFSDSDNDDTSIVKTVQSNSNPSLVNVSITGNTLTLSLEENQSGAAAIEILAESNGQTVLDVFTVTVTAVDDPLTIVSPIDDITVDEDAANMDIDLSSVFSDVDNDDNAIIKPFTTTATQI